MAEKVVERFENERSFTEGRISLSENEKEYHNASKLFNHNTSSSSNNDVYRYFSHSAKIDTDLFNYKKYFNDIMLEQRQANQPDSSLVLKPSKENSLALKQPDEKAMPKKPEIDNCPSCRTHTECSRCHRKLEMFCKDCNAEKRDNVSPETANQLQIEYNPPELPFTKDQQVVVYRPAGERHAPYSFNIEPESMFYKDMLDEMRLLSDFKLANYIKLYGDLRKKTPLGEKNDEPVQSKATGTIPKKPKPVIEKVSSIIIRWILQTSTWWLMLIVFQMQEKSLTPSPNSSSDIEDIINSAQYTVITQIGFAKQQLEMERNKL